MVRFNTQPVLSPTASDAPNGVFENLFDLVPDAMIATDVHGVIVQANEWAGRLFSYRAADLLGVKMERLIATRFREHYAAHREAFLDGVHEAVQELDVYALSSNGKEIPIDATLGLFETGGATYILMVIREVSDRVATRESLERRLALDALVVSISKRLNTPTLEEIDIQVEQSLGELGRFVGAERGYIFETSAGEATVTRTYEWCAPGIESRPNYLQPVPLDVFPWLSEQIKQGHVVHVASIDHLPPEAQAERARFSDEGIQSIINVPMISGGRVSGLIGFDAEHSHSMRWQADEISTFLILQDFFANAIRRKRIGAELQRANRMLQAVTACNDAMIRAKDENTLLQDVCKIVVEAGEYALAWVGFADNDPTKSIRPIAKWGHDDGYVETLNLSWAETGEALGPAARSLLTRTPVASQNIATDPIFETWRERALEQGFASTITVPLIYGDEVEGVLAVYATELAAFDAPEVETLQRFADELAYGIAALRTRELQREAEAALRETMRSKDEFVATIAHELRTPLTAVVGFAQLLRDDEATLSAAERADMIRMVADEGIDLTNIVDDLLVAAKAEAGTLTVAQVPVNLRAQVAQVLENWGQEIVGHVGFDGDSAHTVGDPARVRQILRNLISNSLRYGGENISVHVGTDENFAHVAVVDDGPGVPVTEREAIFEPYRRAHNAPGLTASMGLGLTISRQLARLMGGDLTYQRVNNESIFTLALPRTAD